jgi:hypothetical protein
MIHFGKKLQDTAGPSLVYTISNNGTGQASRQLQSWAKKYRVLDGEGQRLTLFNNWEATYFDFDETKLAALFKDAKNLGVDMFLLDDGWFGNKYPRNNDDAGRLAGKCKETAARPRAPGKRSKSGRRKIRHLDRAGNGKPEKRIIRKTPGLGHPSACTSGKIFP